MKDDVVDRLLKEWISGDITDVGELVYRCFQRGIEVGQTASKTLPGAGSSLSERFDEYLKDKGLNYSSMLAWGQKCYLTGFKEGESRETEVMRQNARQVSEEEKFNLKVEHARWITNLLIARGYVKDHSHRELFNVIVGEILD